MSQNGWEKKTQTRSCFHGNSSGKENEHLAHQTSSGRPFSVRNKAQTESMVQGPKSRVYNIWHVYNTFTDKNNKTNTCPWLIGQMKVCRLWGFPPDIQPAKLQSSISITDLDQSYQLQSPDSQIIQRGNFTWITGWANFTTSAEKCRNYTQST